MVLGRTDKGVYALGQVANFKIESEKLPIEKFSVALNSKLKNSIRIKSSEVVVDIQFIQKLIDMLLIILSSEVLYLESLSIISQ